MYNTLSIARQTKTFRGEEGAKRNRVLVYGSEPGDVVNPGAANAGKIAGVAFDDAADGVGVALSEYAYPEIETAGAVNYGDSVNIADTGGRIKTVSEAAGTAVNLVGIAEEAADEAGQKIMVNVRDMGKQITL